MKNWKEEFDKEFQTTKHLQLDMNVYHVKTHKIQSHRQDIKDFIESLLAEQKKELSNRKMYQCGYNDAKKELIEEILKLGQTDGGYRDMVWKELIESLK